MTAIALVGFFTTLCASLLMSSDKYYIERADNTPCLKTCYKNPQAPPYICDCCESSHNISYTETLWCRIINQGYTEGLNCSDPNNQNDCSRKWTAFRSSMIHDYNFHKSLLISSILIVAIFFIGNSIFVIVYRWKHEYTQIN
jgi:hypothetical protein